MTTITMGAVRSRLNFSGKTTISPDDAKHTVEINAPDDGGNRIASRFDCVTRN
jgi:hypothetical protein